MAVTTVAQLAAELNRPAATLLEQLQSAGVAKASTDDALSEGDKERLLDFLRTSHGTVGSVERKKITLTKKSTSEIKQADASGKARTIQVEVRKKRTFVKRDDASPGGDEQVDELAIDEADLQRREDEANRQAESLRLEAEQIAQQKRDREAQEHAAAEAAAAAERAAAEAAAAAAAVAAAAAAVVTVDAAPAGAAGGRAAAEAATAALNAAGKRKSKIAATAPVAEPVAPVVAVAAPVLEASAPAPEPVVAKPTVRVVRAADIAAEEAQKLGEIEKRRKAAESEAAAIRAMMNGPKRGVMIAKKPEEAKPADGIKGTIHKPTAKPGAPGATALAKPGDKKAVKSEKLSSSWADDAKKRSALKPGARAPAGAGRPTPLWP